MGGQCGCGLPSLGNKRRGTVLDIAGLFAAGGGTSINLDKAQADIPNGMFRYLDYIDIVVTASLTTAGGGAVAAQGWFELIRQISLSHNTWGDVYSGGVLAREIRLLHYAVNGVFASADPAAMGAGAGPTTAVFILRIPFTWDGLERPRDLSIPIHTLPRILSITFGTAVQVGVNVTINSMTMTAYAYYHDSTDMIMPDPWEVTRRSQASANVSVDSGDYLCMFADRTDEAFTRILWTNHTVMGYDPLTKSHDESILGHNADTAIRELLVPNAALLMPLISLPGRPGKRSVRETHGSAVSVSVNLDTGTQTPIDLVSLRRKLGSDEAHRANFKAAFPAAKLVHRKTKSKRHLPINEGNGIPLKATPVFSTSKAKA